MIGDNMIVDLTRLMNNYIERIEIDNTINFSDEYTKILILERLSDVKVVGSISKPESDIYNLNLNLDGMMVLPCALTLEDVEYPFSIEINEILTENVDDDESYFKISGNSIDILPIIWQYIVLEIPARVESKTAYKVNRAGDGWRLITGEDKVDNDTIDPRLEKLTDLLKD